MLKFIEHNWHVPALGNGSFDARAHDFTGLLDFWQRPQDRPVLLNANGSLQNSDS